MPAPKPPIQATVSAQRDFSSGQLDTTIKRRDDDPLMRSGMRQLSNWRILNTRAVQNRPGRSIEFFIPGTFRAEQVAISSNALFTVGGVQSLSALNAVFTIVFFSGGIAFYDANAKNVFTAYGMPWLVANLSQIAWARLDTSVYVVYSGAIFVFTYNAGVWSQSTYNFLLTQGGQLRGPFYRLSPKGIAMAPSATTGNITLTFSTGMNLVAGQVGTRMRFCGRQLLITAVNSPTSANATVIEPLPPGQVLTVATDPRTVFNIGDEIVGGTSLAAGVVANMTATTVSVQLLSASVSTVTAASGGGHGLPGGTTQTVPGFVASETISGPGGSTVINSGGVATTAPFLVTVWDDEVINAFRGGPFSVFADQGRLGFCNIPALPRAIVWSAIGVPTDCYVGPTPDAAMMELIPEAVRVQYVVPGPEGAEFVFCDQRIFYIPINETNPLKPGSVAFDLLSGAGSLPNVAPRLVEDTIVFARGAKSIGAVIATGAYKRPFEMRPLTDQHASLFNNPVAIAIQTADAATFDERYLFVLNGDGTLAVGKYVTENGQIKLPIGWLPWSGAGQINWVAAFGSDVIFSTIYPAISLTGGILEHIDPTQYLDAGVLVNNPPTPLKAPAGHGPLWYAPGASLSLMDGDRSMGTYQIDGLGNIIPQYNGGENLSSPTLMAGLPWTATAEPFVPAVQPSGGGLMRMFRRRIRRLQIYVANSTGFVYARLRSGVQGRNLPAPGAVVVQRRVPTWNEDDDPTQPPPLREESYEFKPLGREHDPRIAIIKDTPGPLQLLEIGMEITT